MKLNQFIEALLEAGWQPILDVQCENIEKLHNRLFPAVASLEDEVRCLNQDFKHLVTKYEELKDKHDTLVEYLYWDN